MNYYIHGDAANADKIKAAFESKGFDVGTNSCAQKGLYFTFDGKVCYTDDYVYPRDMMLEWFIKNNPDYQELELPVEPKFKFKAEDWIVQNDNGTVSQITKTINRKDEYGEHRAYEHTNGYFAACFENEYHLWTIADAKDGDILSAKIDGDDYILIFKQIKDGWIETYGHYYITIDKFCAPTQMFCRNYQGRLYPATQEQYRTLFKKMHDDGYEWDVDKKELRKIKSHYDIANFKPFDKVLTRDTERGNWNVNLFSYYIDDKDERVIARFRCINSLWKQCIPFDGNEHLLGTTDMCDEQYINWHYNI